MAIIETFNEIIVDKLTADSVSILTKMYADINGTKTFIKNHRRAYLNSIIDRDCISKELSEPYLSAVMAVWGDTPTVIDEDYIEE
jgi:hypothetical protein